jgi:beta-hydroxyacyl-ACP dehydratase FabZ
MDAIPHRYPFLLVDRMIELDVGKRGIGYKNVTVNDAFFEGHYPGHPIMPGVLIVESMAQVGALVLLSDPAYRGVKPLLVGFDKVRFKRMVTPGDCLESEAEVLWFRKGVGCMKGISRVNGETVAEAELTFKLMNEDNGA